MEGSGAEQPRKRRSRFSEAVEAETPAPQVLAPVKRPKIDPAALAAAAAAAISKQLPKHMSATADDAERKKLAHEKFLRQQQLIKKTQEQIGQLQALVNPASLIGRGSYLPAPLLLDSEGRHIDAQGNVIEEKVAPVATLKANLTGVEAAEKAKAAKKPVNPYLSYRTIEYKDRVDAVDPRLKTRNRETRGAKNFTFVKQGTYIKQGEQLRAREAKKMLAGFSSGRNPNAYVKETVADVDEDGEKEAPSTATADSLDVPMKMEEPVPEVEWWDIPYLPKEMQETLDKNGFLKGRGRSGVIDYAADMKLRYAGTAHLIEHPARIRVGRKEQAVALPLMLTKAERKRIRRTARAERLKEVQDKIALGLLPPPEPKVKLSNMMRVLQDQAVADPSAIERKVRAQVAQREQNHEMRNLARKLTPEERREKTLRKLKADAAGDIHVAIFRAPDLSHPQHKFKVDVNAQQLHLTGAVVTVQEHPDLNLVVVEGGPKSIKHYVKLMCRRIDWNKRPPPRVAPVADGDGSDDDGGDESGDGGNDGGDREEEASAEAAPAEAPEAPRPKTKKGKCYLVWRGLVAKRAFAGFKFQECKTATTARKVLEAKHVEQYWDMIESYNPLLENPMAEDSDSDDDED
ncbi:U4/U6 small nuclear ribonucleoprotein Prp3 [Achlya hypogyna]|uniref:U4/U6 small nuclear ribonucleoprotein Prp3 n=1 Tax=Achlya hypogyna TaxID=1202772 RepID=A0A1V9YG71_ACHHY|nr:U4/U6 small nuclear ribonucleoprotein Prp3 [Achlya hypogyna]